MAARWLRCLLLVLPLAAGAAPARTEHVSDGAELMAAVARGGGERSIVLDAGTYEISGTLSFERVNQVSVLGSGWNTVIRKTGPGPAMAFADCGFCLVRDLLIVGDGKAQAGIVFGGQSSSNTVDKCRLADFLLSGIRFQGEAARPMSSNVVRDCHFVDNAAAQLYSEYNNDYAISGCQFGAHHSTPAAGAQLLHSSAGNYTGNFHWGNQNALLLGPGSNFNRIQANRLEESQREALIIGSPEPSPAWSGHCSLNIITGNTFHTNSKQEKGRYDAIAAYDAVDTTFTSNQVFSWDSDHFRHRAALALGRGCGTWIVRDNILRHHTGPALVFDAGTGHLVKDNLGQ